VSRRGELAIVLHTHMPYVEGFGTWPFGEEWLWEAIATSYIPLLDVLGRAPLTLSLTPVLCDQLEDPAAMARCQSFLEEVRPASHELDIAHFGAQGEPAVVEQLERSAAGYASAAQRLHDLAAAPGGLLSALGAHASWTSAATHAVLPLLASEAGIALQLESGIASHRRRFLDWGGGLWLPECGYAPWLSEPMEEAGVASSCVELTGLFGLGDPRHLQPLRSEAGPVLWPVDREAMALVWSERGYPSAAAYRSYHGQTPRDHRVWRNDGAPYDPRAAATLVGSHASHFVASVKERVRDGGVCVCALDTELLGHWWHEGVRWLEAVVGEAARQNLRLTTLDDALGRHQPVPVPGDLGVSSWGDGHDLRTWSGPAVADLAWAARSAELRVLALGCRPSDRALRELLALQASDWAFQITRDMAGEYPRQRAHAHAQAFESALEDPGGLAPELRNLAPYLAGWLG
jgi:1,4-alpha-glucan branching enzyme